MTMTLNKKDYSKILKYYNLPIPRSMNEMKKKAEEVLALKLCRCIKKVSPSNEAKAIGVCTRTIFKRKKLTRGAFTCKRNQSVQFSRLRKRTIKNVKRYAI
jgi:hypothetical protein